jgi:hypothetical protein
VSPEQPTSNANTLTQPSAFENRIHSPLTG